MAEIPEDLPFEEEIERPLECTECRKQIKVHYTEIIGKKMTTTAMCNDCPELQKRLHGVYREIPEIHPGVQGSGLACGNCGATLESVRFGHLLGCSECYEVFHDVIVADIVSSKKVPLRSLSSQKNQPLHIGRAPGEAQELNPALKLLALNEALTETLKNENYEQAALLRDQINELTKESESKDDGQ